MIAGTPPAIVMYLRKLKQAREARRMARAPMDGGALSVEETQLLLPPSGNFREGETALSGLPPPQLPPSDILALPDRDHLRHVVPDFEHLEYDG